MSVSVFISAKKCQVVYIGSQDKKDENKQNENMLPSLDSPSATRPRISCPIPGCVRTIHRVPSHLQQYHRMTQEGSREILKLLVVEMKQKAKSGDRVYKICPLCYARVVRIDKHRMRKHKMSKEEWKAACRGETSNNCGGQGDTEDIDVTHFDACIQAITDCKDVGTWTSESEDVVPHCQTCNKKVSVEERPADTLSTADNNSCGEPSSADTLSTTDNSSSGESSSTGTISPENNTEHVEVSSSFAESSLEDEPWLPNKQMQCSSEVLNHMEKFEKWLTSVEGGKKSEATAKLYKGEATHVMAYLGGKMGDISKYRRIAKPGGLLENVEHLSATSQRSLLYGFSSFLSYCQLSGTSAPLCDQEMSVARKNISNYATALRGDVQLQKERRKEKMADAVPTLLSTIAKYNKSDHFKRTTSLLLSTGRLAITRSNFTHIKACLITQFVIGNGQRAGVIINARVEQFRAAQNVGKYFIMRVAQHKTRKHGSARLTMSTQLHDHMKIYLNIRKRFVGGHLHAGYLFPTPSGTAMKYSRLSYCLQIALKETSVTATTIRMATVVMAREMGTSESAMADLSQHMSHAPATRDEYYDVRRKDILAANVAEHLDIRINTYSSGSMPEAVKSQQQTSNVKNANIKSVGRVSVLNSLHVIQFSDIG